MNQPSLGFRETQFNSADAEIRTYPRSQNYQFGAEYSLIEQSRFDASQYEVQNLHTFKGSLAIDRTDKNNGTLSLVVKQYLGDRLFAYSGQVGVLSVLVGINLASVNPSVPNKPSGRSLDLYVPFPSENSPFSEATRLDAEPIDPENPVSAQVVRFYVRIKPNLQEQQSYATLVISAKLRGFIAAYFNFRANFHATLVVFGESITLKAPRVEQRLRNFTYA